MRILKPLLVVFFMSGVAALAVQADDLVLKPFSFQEGFEDKDPTKLLSEKGACTLHFKGLVTDRAAYGQKALKIDLTFDEDGLVRWQIPLDIPAEGELTFTARAALGKETSPEASLTFQARFVAEPIQMGNSVGIGCQVTPSAQEDWIEMETDLVQRGRATAHGLVGFRWGVVAENVGVFIDFISIDIRGKKGDRVVAYVDDIRIQGRLPARKAYEDQVRRRYAPADRRIRDKIRQWEQSLRDANARLKRLSSAPNDIKAQAQEFLQRVQSTIDRMKSEGVIKEKELSATAAMVRAADFAVDNVPSAGKAPIGGALYCYQTGATDGTKILPDTYPVPGRLTEAVSVTAAPGEYEPVSLVLRPVKDKDLTGVTLTISDLTREGSEAATIPKSDIDVKVVKCWYQAEGAWEFIAKRGREKVLVPELLLNDETLLRVDTNEKSNYLRLSFPEGEKHVWLDDPKEGWSTPTGNYGPVITPKTEEFPVRDSDSLAPVDIPANTNKQFWITIKAPDDAPAGTYTGRITITSQGKPLGRLKLSVRVLPFHLAPPRTHYDLTRPFTSLVYYNGMFKRHHKTGKLILDTINDVAKNETQLRNDMHNFYTHQINPTVNQDVTEKELFERYLRIRNEAGLKGWPIYFNGNPGFCTGNPTDPAALEALKQKVQEVYGTAKTFGIPEVYVYGIDEAVGERLKSERPAWEAVHAAGGKVWVAGSLGTFEIVGDLLDVFNHGAGRGGPDPKLADQWHAAGHKILNYGNPQGGVENPELYRRNYGLLLWKADYDGGGPWAYQSSAFGGMWNDFNADRRASAMAYPTADSYINTIAWEGFREAIDDVRYATTLRLAIEKAKKGSDDAKRQRALAAEKYLNDLDVSGGNLDAIRETIVSYILAIQ